MMARRWSLRWIDSSPWGVSTEFIVTHTQCTPRKTELLLSTPTALQNSVNCQKCNFAFSSYIFALKLYFNFKSIETAWQKDRWTNRSKSIDRGSTAQSTKKRNSWVTPCGWMDKWMGAGHWLIFLISQE